MEPVGIIRVSGLKIYAYHGLLPQEQELGNRFQVDIKLKYPISKLAYVKDDLDGTLNYARVVELAQEVMSKPSKLLENVVWRLKTTLEEHFPMISGGKITVTKLIPPIDADLEGVGVTVVF